MFGTQRTVARSNPHMNIKHDTEQLSAQLHELLARNLIAAAQRELRMAQQLAIGAAAARKPVNRTNRRKVKS